MRKKKKSKKKKKNGGICYRLLVVNRQRRKDFCFAGNGGLDRMGMGRTPTQADAIWNHGTDRKHILGPLQLLPNLPEWKSHCDARARTWTEDIVAVHVTCMRCCDLRLRLERYGDGVVNCVYISNIIESVHEIALYWS